MVDDDGIDITDLSIYYDSHKDQFKHRFTCPTCGIVTAGCVCYPSLDDAVRGSKNEWYCNRHYVQELWYDLDFQDLIDSMFDLGIATIVEQFEDIKNGYLYDDKTKEFRDKEIGARMAECNARIKGLSDNQMDAICSEIECDCDITGYACEA